MLLLLLFISIAAASCTLMDKRIFARESAFLPHKLRALGGLTVGHEAYKYDVIKTTGFTEECATCFADVYICGFKECWWSCKSEGDACTECLKISGCLGKFNECTQF